MPSRRGFFPGRRSGAEAWIASRLQGSQKNGWREPRTGLLPRRREGRTRRRFRRSSGSADPRPSACARGRRGVQVDSRERPPKRGPRVVRELLAPRLWCWKRFARRREVGKVTRVRRQGGRVGRKEKI